MTRLIAAAIALSSFSVSVVAAANSYHLNARVERDDVIVADNEIDVDEGVDADLQMRNRDDMVSTRIVARIERADVQSKAKVVHLQYFEKRNQAWALIGEPSFVVEPGIEGFMTFADKNSHSGRYKIAVKVEQRLSDQSKQSVLDR